MIRITLILGVAQTLAWASSYYIPAIAAEPMAADLGVDSAWIYGAFSAALLIAAVLGPRIGRTIDRIGGRGVLAASNIAIAAGLVVLALAQSLVVSWIGWLVLGVGMALGLYDSAFAALGRIFGAGARPAITGITLLAGFASTVGWPLTAWGIATIGWRDTCLAWAVANIVLGLPLNLLLPRGASVPARVVRSDAKPDVRMDSRMWLLASGFALGWMVTSAMAVHLPRILESVGATTAEAIAAGALVGPAQVAARLMEVGVMRRYHPLFTARLAAAAHPVGVALLALTGGALPYVFVVLHGAGNGILTIARGTVPLAVFGPQNYGYRLGLIGAPARLAQAVSPMIFGFLIDPLGGWVLTVSAALSLLALATFACIRPRSAL
jgi:MFS family permease